MTSPKDDQEPQSAREILATLHHDLRCYSELVSLDEQLSKKSAQLEQLIADIKEANTKASKEDADRNFELEKNFTARSKECDNIIRLKKLALEKLIVSIGDSEAQLTEYKSQSELYIKKNADIEDMITEKQSIYEELAGKVEQQRDLYENYKRLTEDQRRLNEEYASDVRKAKIEHDETIAGLNQKLANFKSANAVEQEVLSSQLAAERDTLQKVKSEITNARAEDAERIKNLRTDEDSLSIKIKAFNREREEFEGERKRLARASRV